MKNTETELSAEELASATGGMIDVLRIPPLGDPPLFPPKPVPHFWRDPPLVPPWIKPPVIKPPTKPPFTIPHVPIDVIWT